MKRFGIAIIVFVMTVLIASNAFAYNIGLIHAENYSPNVSSVVNYLSNYFGGGSTITSIDGTSQTPSIATLNTFDSVLVWENVFFQDGVGLGNNLANYIDGGGGVVLAAFDFYGTNPQKLAGGIMGSNYSPFSPIGNYFSSANLGTYDNTSPIMNGVTSLMGYYRDNVDLNAGAQLVASWTDGGELAAWNHGGQVVGITLYPGSQVPDGMMSGNYAELFGNSLIFSANAAQPSAVPEPASLSLLGLGLLGLSGLKKRKEIGK